MSRMSSFGLLIRQGCVFMFLLLCATYLANKCIIKVFYYIIQRFDVTVGGKKCIRPVNNIAPTFPKVYF